MIGVPLVVIVVTVEVPNVAVPLGTDPVDQLTASLKLEVAGLSSQLASWAYPVAGASQPAADGSFADTEGDGRVAQGEAELAVSECHLGSRERSEFGISVHVVRAGGRWVECSSTTSLHDPFRADNVLKHDT